MNQDFNVTAPKPPAPPPRLRLRVIAAAESRLRSGHPWLFADSVVERNREGKLGEIAVVYDRKDRFLAVGLYDPRSPIQLRVLHAGKPQPLDAGWWAQRLQQACERRRSVQEEHTTGYRWIHGESDGWPGLVLDRYDQTLVLKLYSGVWLPRLAEVVQLIRETLCPERVVLRLSRNLQPLAEKEFGCADGLLLCGLPVEGPVVFQESGLRFEAEVLRGQKTGFFLDQRENRRKVEALAGGRRVLNAFSFSGGFSLYAARGGARTVTDIDISPHALASAQRNFALNASDPHVAGCGRERIQADVFEWLVANGERQFDLVILDPPSLAKRESEKAGAIRAYHRLAALGLQHLAPGGLLVACSCSAHVPAEEFFAVVRQALSKAGRRLEELETTRHPLDHPAAFKEAEYLKGIYFRCLGTSPTRPNS
jgi:23S rRNA (cytosine1962-C5)-methyltransferase